LKKTNIPKMCTVAKPVVWAVSSSQSYTTILRANTAWIMVANNFSPAMIVEVYFPI
jgi:uncharacterized membrane protein